MDTEGKEVVGLDRSALGRLHEITAGDLGSETVIERLLSLGCEHLGFDTAAVSRTEDGGYTTEAVVGSTEEASVGDLNGVRKEVPGSEGGVLGFADASETDRDLGGVGSYLGVPVVLGGEVYGLVEFLSEDRREKPVSEGKKEFAKLTAHRIGKEVERKDRLGDCEMYETVLESVDDPVYALDAEGRFRFLNEAAKREFGYGQEVLGEHVSVGMETKDIEDIEGQMRDLIENEEPSMRAEFELETADGGTKTVENRLGLIENDGFRGTAGVLRDVTDRKERKRELESFRKAIERAADGVAVLEDDEYVYVDRTHVEMYGLDDKEELLGETWRKLYDDEEVKRLEEDVFPVLEEEGHWRGRVTGTRPDGTEFPAELSLTMTTEERLVCTVRDETERQRRKEELELKERAMDEASVGIQITDPSEEDNPLTYVNRGFEEMTGYTREEALGENPRFLQGGDSESETVAELREAIDAEKDVSVELENYRADGTPYWSRLSITPVHGDDGEVKNYIGIGQDITERKERERELERYEAFVENSSDLTVHLDESGEILYQSPGTQRIFGHEPGANVGENVFEYVHPEDREGVLKTFNDGLEEPGGGKRSVEFRMEDDEGEYVWLEAAGVDLRDTELGGIVVNAREITERKRREKEREATVEVLKSVYEVTTDQSLSFGEKVDGLLEAGREYLDLPNGFLTRIERENTGSEEGEQSIVEANGSHELLQPGESCPLPKSYCRKTIRSPELMTVTNAPESGWTGDPAYEVFGLDTYIAGKVTAGGELYGTLCFASEEPRGNDFTETERSFVSLLRRWAGYEIDRKRAREELRDQRQRLDLTLSGTGTGIAEWDLRTDEVSWNETLVEAVGRDVDDIDGLTEAVHTEDRDRVRRSLEEAVETGEPWVGEFRVFGEDGEVIWLGTRAVAEYENGDAVRVLATVTDITEKKRTERRYRRLAENIPNGAVLTFDADLRYELAAGELISELGLDESEIHGTAVGELGLNEDEDVRQWSREALEGERTDRRLGIEGGDRTVRVHIVPMGGEEGGLMLAQDVTEEAKREDQLRRERERFRLLTESVGEYAFITLDEDGDVGTWNEGAESLFGYDTEEAVGTPMARLHPESDREEGLPERLIQQASVSGEVGHEGPRVRADGSEFYADVRYSRLETEEGGFRGYAMILRDMTDRRRRQRRTERLLEESEEVISVLDEDGNFEYVGGSAGRVMGHESEDIVGKNFFDTVHPDDREGAMEAFFDCLEDRGSGIHRAECRLESGDTRGGDEEGDGGGWMNAELRYRNMLDDEAIDGVVLYVLDVTETKERVRRFEAIFNSTFQFIGLLDVDGTTLEANDTALDFAGSERQDIVGNPFWETAWWEDSEEKRRQVREDVRKAAEGDFVRHEIEAVGKRGLATLDFSIRPVTDDEGEVVLLIPEGREITDKKRQRQHLQVLQRVMRHNMRNDLNKVGGFVDLLAGEDEMEKREEYAETVEAVLGKWEGMTEKMGRIRNIIDTPVEEERTEAGALVEGAVSEADERYPEADVSCEVPEDLTATVPTVMRDGVDELIGNAVEASREEGEGEEGNNGNEVDTETVSVSVSVSASSDWVEIGVSDNGPGMPEMEAKMLEEGEETPLEHGRGMGLWMVRMVALYSGGEASVDTTPEGTTVTLRSVNHGPEQE